MAFKSKEVEKQYFRELYQTNKTEIKRKRHEYYLKNKDKIKEGWRERYYNNRDSILKRRRQLRELNKEEFNSKKRERTNHIRRQNKIEVFNHYGNRCTCCGETEPLFLTIDHINNDGAKHRKLLFKKGGGSHGGFYHWIIKNHFPKEFQILCWNCNSGKWLNKGICPHISNET